MILGLTATLVVAIAAVINIQNSATDKSEAEFLLTRGGNATTLIVEAPEVRLAELVQGLRAVGEDAVIQRISNGSIVLTLNASPKVLDYLDTQRVVPKVVDGKTTLLLMRPKSPQK